MFCLCILIECLFLLLLLRYSDIIIESSSNPLLRLEFVYVWLLSKQPQDNTNIVEQVEPQARCFVHLCRGHRYTNWIQLSVRQNAPLKVLFSSASVHINQHNYKFALKRRHKSICRVAWHQTSRFFAIACESIVCRV